MSPGATWPYALLVAVAIRAVAPLLVATLLLVGAPASLGAGVLEPLTRYTVPGEGISLSVPSSWRAIDYRRARSIDEIKRFVQADPDFYPPIETLTNPGSPLKFVAINPLVDFRTPEGRAIRSSINILVGRASAGLTLEHYRLSLVDQIRRIVKPVRMIDDVVEIGGKQAIRIRLTQRRQVGRYTFRFNDTQYAFVRPGQTVVVTYETLTRVAGRYAAVLRASAESISVR